MNGRILKLALSCIVPVIALGIAGCGMSAQQYYSEGQKGLKNYDCGSDTLFNAAAAKEYEDEGNWYPVYMMSVGLSRTYCANDKDALKAFQTVDQFTVKKSQVSEGKKVAEFLSVSSRRMYELTEREETLLHYYMGYLAYRNGDYEDALIELKKVDYIAQGRYSALPLSAMMRGMTYVKLRDPSNAQVAFRQMMETNPSSPLGYKLAILNESDQAQKDFLVRTMKEKTGVEFTPPPDGRKPVIVMVDVGEEINRDHKINISCAGSDNCASFVDVVDPNFDFGKAMGAAIKEVGSEVAREVASQLTFGLSGLFFGSGGSDKRKWDTLPAMFYGDIVYMDGTSKQLSIKHLDGNDVEKERTLDLSVPENTDIAQVRF